MESLRPSQTVNMSSHLEAQAYDKPDVASLAILCNFGIRRRTESSKCKGSSETHNTDVFKEPTVERVVAHRLKGKILC
ncbi:hypothetical protein NDU88_008706 [Pleurodeles waltl]|uniref:Uncharacterized protein n=1 Tax=Pleurodeles waltl TaxID=8319 RepID=A0AAV7QQP7_PLEWA|nr:hypothetical protein NDU88_008706 [Pleurodeles waltl]